MYYGVEDFLEKKARLSKRLNNIIKQQQQQETYKINPPSVKLKDLDKKKIDSILQKSFDKAENYDGSGLSLYHMTPLDDLQDAGINPYTFDDEAHDYLHNRIDNLAKKRNVFLYD